MYRQEPHVFLAFQSCLAGPVGGLFSKSAVDEHFSYVRNLCTKSSAVQVRKEAYAFL